ncbi:hypothetical protein HOY82DRAFT_554917 [Tuber indicum]|nr:hypothetical protein HOY82DRAFT_554917 [Tuber indicum]
MGPGFVVLARVPRWVGSGSLGRLWASLPSVWLGLGMLNLCYPLNPTNPSRLFFLFEPSTPVRWPERTELEKSIYKGRIGAAPESCPMPCSARYFCAMEMCFPPSQRYLLALLVPFSLRLSFAHSARFSRGVWFIQSRHSTKADARHRPWIRYRTSVGTQEELGYHTVGGKKWAQ